MASCFIDTMGFYSLLDKRDSHHEEAKSWMALAAKAGAKLSTSDYVLDEAATLLKFRKLGHLCHPLFQLIDSSRALTVIRVDADRFQRARAYFLKRIEHGYSFTDCSSFICMKEHRIKDVLTHDKHFGQAGFNVLL